MSRRMLSLVVLVAAAAALGAGDAWARAHVPSPQRVTVTMTDYKFALSSHTVERGRPVVFTVVNRGKVSHDFHVKGHKATKILAPGHRTRLTMTFPKNGEVAYLCDVPGHAKLGMRGKLRVVRNLQLVQAASAAAQTIHVTMVDYSFKVARHPALKAGVKYTFDVVNRGKTVHNFDIQGLKATPISPPGDRKMISVVFRKAGKYEYLCDVPRHAELGMVGTLVVTK
jgi:uncharacterized cupredoxin-like copper-binding protein